MLTSLHCLWKAQSVSSLDENIHLLSNESHPQRTVTCDYGSRDLPSSSSTAHAVSSHSFHPPPWDMFIICVSPTDAFKCSFSVSTSEVDGNIPPLQWQQQHWRSIAFSATCFLGSQFSSCSESQCYHHRPLRSLAGLLSLKAQHLHQGWRVWRFEQSPLTYQNDSKDI